MIDPLFYLYGFFLFLSVNVSYLVSGRDYRLPLLIAITFILLSGVRSIDVPDTSIYLHYFDIYTPWSAIKFDGLEVGYIALNYIIKSIGDSHLFFLIAVTTINLCFIIASLRLLNVNVVFGLIAYISYYGFMFDFIFLRVGIAASLIIFSFSLLHARRNFISRKFFLVSSFLFHTTSVFTFPLYFMYKIRITKLIALILIFFSIIIYSFGITDGLIEYIFIELTDVSIFSRYKYYVDNFAHENGLSVRYYFNAVILSVVIICTTNFRRMSFFVLIVLIGLFLQAFFSSFLLVDRIVDLFIMFIFIVIAIFASEKKNDEYSYFNVSILLCYVTISLFFSSRILRAFVLPPLV